MQAKSHIMKTMMRFSSAVCTSLVNLTALLAIIRMTTAERVELAFNLHTVKLSDSYMQNLLSQWAKTAFCFVK